MSAGPTYHSILVVDVENSSGRSDPEKTALRQTLYQLLMAAFARSGLMWDECRGEDRGDGVYLLIPGTIRKLMLITVLINTLDQLLREQRELDRIGGLLRLRVALHAGEVTIDNHGSSGADSDIAFALVNAGLLRATLRAAKHGRLALILSDAFYLATVRHRYPGLDPRTFTQVILPTKQGPVHAWIQVPGYETPPVPPDTSG
jgi:hypothetical protein